MRLQPAISSSIIAFRDGWRLFAVLSILVCAALILVPQFRLLTASLIREGGRFTIQHQADDQRLEFITATADNYDSKDLAYGLSITDAKGQPFLELRSRDPQSVIISDVQGGLILAQDVPGGRIAIKVGNRHFTVSQEAPIAIFAPSEARRILTAVPMPNGILLEHSRGAFLTFVDSSSQLSTWNYAAFLSSNRYLGALWNSAVVTVISTAVATIIGVGLSYLVARFSILGGTRLILTLVAIASISPSFLGAYAWRLLFSSNGILANLLDLEGSIVGTHGVIWVLVWLNFPIVFLLSYDAFASADEAMQEAAMSVGANRWLTFLKVELPLAAPGIITGLYLAAMAAFTDFGTPSIISLDINILPVVIYRDFMGEIGSNPSMASTGSIMMVLISTVLLAAQRAYLAALSFASVGGKRTMVRSLSPKLRIFATALVWGTLGVAFVPHLTVAAH